MPQAQCVDTTNRLCVARVTLVRKQPRHWLHANAHVGKTTLDLSELRFERGLSHSPPAVQRDVEDSFASPGIRSSLHTRLFKPPKTLLQNHESEHPRSRLAPKTGGVFRSTN